MTYNIYNDIKSYTHTVLNDANIAFKQEPFVGTNDKYNYLYITINHITSKFYIGLHTCDKPFDSAYKGSGKALKLSFKKYGRDNFESFPLCYVDNRSVLSLAEAAVQLGKCKSAIATACRTGYRCGGYYWRYA